MLLNRLSHVNYNFVARVLMNQSYQKGLKLKNSLTGELVTIIFMLRNNLFRWMATMLLGTHVVQLYTRIVTWATLETIFAMI